MHQKGGGGEKYRDLLLWWVQGAEGVANLTHTPILHFSLANLYPHSIKILDPPLYTVEIGINSISVKYIDYYRK